MNNRTRHKLLMSSHDYQLSQLRGYLKFFLSCLLFIDIKKISDEDDSSKRSRILLLCAHQYRKKKELFDQLADSLNASIFIITYSFFKKPLSKLLSMREIVLASEVNYHYKLVIHDLKIHNLHYNIVQHGDFDINNPENRLINELLQMKVDIFYIWRLVDLPRYRSLSGAQKIAVLDFVPSETKQKIYPGLGFATRGREFLKSDVVFLIENKSALKCQRVHFHPSYTLLLKIYFLFKIWQKVKFLYIAPRLTLSEELITKSISMKNALIRYKNDGKNLS